MAEDTKTPARTVPMAMFWSVATSYGLGWIVSPSSASTEGVFANNSPHPFSVDLRAFGSTLCCPSLSSSR